ncbi:MAG: hypothetical protein K6B41_06335, partial [Butyrivibrio sp.]|nr:hypothetical protein [Butyrivibrio sp.]
MDLKEKLKKRKEKRLERLEQRDARRREDRQSGIGVFGKIKRAFLELKLSTRITAVILVLVIILGASYGSYYYVTNIRQNGSDDKMKDMMGMNDNNSITASGTTTMGMVEETFDVDSLETELEIEEVYVNNGEEVEAGAPILKISDESLAEARTELEEAAKEADYAYRLGVISTEETKITAKATYDSATVSATYAQNDYNSTVQDALEKVQELEDQVEEAQELVNEYQASVDSDYYYTYYDIENLKNTVTENFAALMEFYEEWNV